MRGACEESELISALKNAGLATDQERLDEYADRFLEHIEHIQEVRPRTVLCLGHIEHIVTFIKRPPYLYSASPCHSQQPNHTLKFQDTMEQSLKDQNKK